ncbi:hypothetical protein HK405_012738 [Cladochytrium tenue]|nr:hypothetical protein HK405_012738 [Cladochytrium tenue]
MDVSVGISVAALILTLVRILRLRSTLNWLCLAAAICITIKSAALAAYGYLPNRSCQARFFFAYAFLNPAKILVDLLYEQRLAILLVGVACNPFRWIILALLVAYVPFTAVQVSISMSTCYVSPTGAYLVSSAGASICKYTANALDIAISCAILAGSITSLVFATFEGRHRHRQAAGGSNSRMIAGGAAPSTELRLLILQSDALRFLAVFPVDAYKMYAAFDPSGTSGPFFPPGPGNGNNGLLVLLDAYKVAAMIVLLVLPSVLLNAKAASSASYTSSAKSSSRGIASEKGLTSARSVDTLVSSGGGMVILMPPVTEPGKAAEFV